MYLSGMCVCVCVCVCVYVMLCGLITNIVLIWHFCDQKMWYNALFKVQLKSHWFS